MFRIMTVFNGLCQREVATEQESLRIYVPTFRPVMWIRIQICMDPQVFETPNPDPESAYFGDPDPGSKEFFLVISKNMYVHAEI